MLNFTNKVSGRTKLSHFANNVPSIQNLSLTGMIVSDSVMDKYGLQIFLGFGIES